MNREEVYLLIDSERDYQDSKPPRPSSDEDTSVAEWLLYIEFHLEAAKRNVYHLDLTETMGHIRKLTALGVACMEHNDAPRRQG